MLEERGAASAAVDMSHALALAKSPLRHLYVRSYEEVEEGNPAGKLLVVGQRSPAVRGVVLRLPRLRRRARRWRRGP